MTATVRPRSTSAEVSPPGARRRDARIRALAFAAFGLLAIYLGDQGAGTPATFSFWITEQGGESRHARDVGHVLWIVAGVVTVFVAVLQLVRGASLPVAALAPAPRLAVLGGRGARALSSTARPRT